MPTDSRTADAPPGSAPPGCWADAIRFAADEVDKLAAHFVGNTKSDGMRDSLVYEQGIGCERAGQMLREIAAMIERQNMKCEICNKGMPEGVTLHRVNELGVKGIWRCNEHVTSEQLATHSDPETLRLVRIIEGANAQPNASDQRPAE